MIFSYINISLKKYIYIKIEYFNILAWHLNRRIINIVLHKYMNKVSYLIKQDILSYLDIGFTIYDTNGNVFITDNNFKKFIRKIQTLTDNDGNHMSHLIPMPQELDQLKSKFGYKIIDFLTNNTKYDFRSNFIEGLSALHSNASNVLVNYDEEIFVKFYDVLVKIIDFFLSYDFIFNFVKKNSTIIMNIYKLLSKRNNNYAIILLLVYTDMESAYKYQNSENGKDVITIYLTNYFCNSVKTHNFDLALNVWENSNNSFNRIIKVEFTNLFLNFVKTKNLKAVSWIFNFCDKFTGKYKFESGYCFEKYFGSFLCSVKSKKSHPIVDTNKLLNKALDLCIANDDIEMLKLLQSFGADMENDDIYCKSVQYKADELLWWIDKKIDKVTQLNLLCQMEKNNIEKKERLERKKITIYNNI
jgi:hypothetical protein